MIDRAIGILGIAIALITLVVQSYFPTWPTWTPWVIFGVGVFLSGLSLGLLASGGLSRTPKRAKRAALKLHIFGDHRAPERIDHENIFRWYYLQNALMAIGPSGPEKVAGIATLYISFDPEVDITTLRVRSPDMALPVYEVKEFNQRYAIITFSDNVPTGTLEVVVAP
jgi:hypothetical protein